LENEETITKTYKLLDEKGKPYISNIPGKFGGNKKLKIYGKLDCPSALRYIAKGQYVKNRVFFADEKTAIKAGYRPCSICMKEAYREWKANPSAFTMNGIVNNAVVDPLNKRW